MKRRGLVLLALSLPIGFVGACGGSGRTPTPVVVGGSPDVGKREIAEHGCGSCHDIPGVKGADGLVGPPLTKFGRRSYIAGELNNTPDNLIRWLRDPQGVEPGTDMPDVGLSAVEARNIAAYLEGLG